MHRYLIEDCPLILDGKDTGHFLPPMVGEFTVNRRGGVECDALYLADGGTKVVSGSCETAASPDEKLGPDFTDFPGSRDTVESAVEWADDYIKSHSSRRIYRDPHEEHRLGSRALGVGRAA